MMVAIIFFSANAFCRPITAPGSTVGLPLGKPFPTGWYLINSAGYGSIPRGANPSTNIFFNESGLAYVSDKEIAKGRLEFYGFFSEAFYRAGGEHAWIGNVYNPDVLAGLAWDLGHNFYFSNFVGTYFPINTQGLSNDSFVFNERAAVTYSTSKNEATIHAIYGAPAPGQTPFKPNLPNYINLDITYTHLFGKLQIGPIAFGSWDTNSNNPWSEFAVGGLVGYDFSGLFSLQGWLAKDTNANHWGNFALSGFVRLLIHLDAKKDTQRSGAGM